LIERAIDLQAATLPPYPYPKETLKYCKGAKEMAIRGCYYQMESDVTTDMDRLLHHALSFVPKPAELEDQQDMWKAEMDDLCAFTETQGNSGIERELMCKIVWTQIRIAELKKTSRGST
ncbi:MAG: hypothetical protein LUC43_03465, partial [Burkholderiales bacterium]|nr:hypothetical protein [Burkholderiales bacterium]